MNRPPILLIHNLMDIGVQISQSFKCHQFYVQHETSLHKAMKVLETDSFPVIVFRMSISSNISELLHTINRFGRNEYARRIAVLDARPVKIDEAFQKRLKVLQADAAFYPVIAPDGGGIRLSPQIIEIASKGYFSDRELDVRGKNSFIDLGLPVVSGESPVSRSRREG